MVLQWMPVAQNSETGAPATVGDSPIKAVLRSKGFMWMSHNHMTAYYWSHAGQHFEIRDEGDWCVLNPVLAWMHPVTISKQLLNLAYLCQAKAGIASSA